MAKHAALLLGCLILLGPRTTLAGDEPPIHGEGRALPYLKALHTKVHRLWAESFLLMAEGQLPKDHPINVPTRAVRLEVLLGPEGKLADVTVKQASGSTDFDTSAVDVVKASAPFAVAPEEVLSDDGKAHVVWTFARDDRRCSGAEVELKNFPIDEAVPLLVAQGRESVALERLKAADEKERENGFTKFARAWLDRTEDDKDLALQVAAAYASVGVDRGAERLRKAVDFVDGGSSAEAEVARGLAALKIPVCPLVRDALAKRTIVDTVSLPTPGSEPSDDAFVQKLKQHESRERVLHLTAEGTDGACLAFAIAVANDRRASAVDRMLAISALDHSDGAEPKDTLKALLKDNDPRVRAAAVAADARAATGKGAVFRLIPLLRDSSTAVRSAAAAGLVHVGGEAVLPQLFLVFRERDPLVYEAVAAELAKHAGQVPSQGRPPNPAGRCAGAGRTAGRISREGPLRPDQRFRARAETAGNRRAGRRNQSRHGQRFQGLHLDGVVRLARPRRWQSWRRGLGDSAVPQARTRRSDQRGGRLAGCTAERLGRRPRSSLASATGRPGFLPGPGRRS